MRIIQCCGTRSIFYFCSLLSLTWLWYRQRQEKKTFLNLWSMASSILMANWVFLGEQSESGAAGATPRNDNTKSNQHLRHPKASSATCQVFPIFLLFLPASFWILCRAEHLCWQISPHPYVTPEVPAGRMLTAAVLTCSQTPLERARGADPCAARAAFPWMFMPPHSELRSDTGYDTWKYSIRIAINIH